MKVIILLTLISILHIIVFVGVFLALFGIIFPELIKHFLIALALLILIDIIFGLYYLISKPVKKEGRGYHKLKIEEADKKEVKR